MKQVCLAQRPTTEWNHSFTFIFLCFLVIESLKQQIVNAHKALAEIAAGKGEDSGDDYIEARIKFLQHQVKILLLI